MTQTFSDYIIYVDESGDHGLKNIDINYPVFVLAFCIFKKQDYINTTTQNLQRFKFRHFGHDQVVLHETDIRRDRGAFSFLKSKDTKQQFINELTEIIEKELFALICTAIKKEDYRARHHTPDNPYHVALAYGLKRVFCFLNEQNAHIEKTHIVFERRGKKEDDELALEFRRICDGLNDERKQLPFELIFSDKKSNSTGLQLADLVARPIGLHLIRPEQNNRAFNSLRTKFYGGLKNPELGLQCFP